MKRSEPESTNYCKTKNPDPSKAQTSWLCHDLTSLSKYSTQITVTLDTLPPYIISYILSSLSLLEKYVIKFVCKKIRSIVHRVSVSKKNRLESTKLYENAALNGYFKTLQWVVEIGSFENASICNSAVKGGHLEILKMARDNGCYCDACTCAYAVSNGHLDILK
jgi:hypothetical protein